MKSWGIKSERYVAASGEIRDILADSCMMDDVLYAQVNGQFLLMQGLSCRELSLAVFA